MIGPECGVGQNLGGASRWYQLGLRRGSLYHRTASGFRLDLRAFINLCSLPTPIHQILIIRVSPTRRKPWYVLAMQHSRSVVLTSSSKASNQSLDYTSFFLAALTAGGGIMGYAKTRSLPSIIAGCSVGALCTNPGMRLTNPRSLTLPRWSRRIPNSEPPALWR